MTEQEMTVAVLAAARALWAQRMETYPPGARKDFDELGPLDRVEVMEAVMPLAIAAAEAVKPIIQHHAWQEGYDDSYSVNSTNPYPVVL